MGCVMENNRQGFEEFYSNNADRYAEVTHEFIQSVYSNVSHAGLTGDLAIMDRLKELTFSGAKGLDAGCGSGARDVFYYWADGYDVIGIDAVAENIRVARELHPEISDRVSVWDLTQLLQYPDEAFDFILCNAVIQHIDPYFVKNVTLPELCRVLKTGGVFQLMFKNGDGLKRVYDKDYMADRVFQTYNVDEICYELAGLGLEIIDSEGNKIGGIMYFTDTKPMEHCLLFARKMP